MLSGIAIISYSLTAVAFVALSSLLLTIWRGRVHGLALAAACGLTALWGVAIALQLALNHPVPLLTDILEILRSGGWSTFILLLLRYSTRPASLFKGRLRLSALGVGSFYFLVLLATLAVYWPGEQWHGEFGFVTGIVARVAAALIGLLLIEQLYRNTPANNRWGIKFLCLGTGGLFAFDFYLFSDAMLFKHVNAEIWSARGVVDALMAPLIAVAAARNPQWPLEISVSRRVLFHTATLFGSAVYLLIMAAAGYYLRFFGGSWGGVLQVAFLFGAVVLLISILFSGMFRSRLKVFISKNFFNYTYDYREEWLRFTRTLAQEGYGLGERAIKAVAELVESPSGILFVCRESGDCDPTARWNMPSLSTAEPLNGDFCQFLEHRKWVIDLQECSNAPEKYGTFTVPQWLQEIPNARLVVPLILHGKLFGFVVLAHPRSKIRLNWEVTDLLKIAGSQAASFLAQQESSNALMISRQFDSFNRMSTFVVHDLKNLVSQLSLLLANASKHKNNPAFQKDMMETVDLSIQKMKRLLEKLSSGSYLEKPAPIVIENLLQKVVSAKSTAEPKPCLEILNHGMQILAEATSLERVIGHLIQNAIEATPKDGKVWVRLAQGDGKAIIEVHDTGHGMSADFIQDRLFKPFESTKSAGMGIGVFESREYARELGGELDVVSSHPGGTIFRMSLPCYNDANKAAILTSAQEQA
jgi:putative PEP-CTERM system histidine kinase